MARNTENGRRTGNGLIHRLRATMPVVFSLSWIGVGVLMLGTAAANPAFCQPSGQGGADGERKEDFLFSRPKGFIGFRVGRFFPQAQGEIFDFITDELTLDRNDFRAWDLVFDGGFSLHERFDLVLGMEYMKRTKYSEFREWVDEQDLPITQKTYYSQFPMTIGAKILLIPRGHRVGNYAWLPSRVVPYVGMGAGVLHYSFGQSGDFVDASTLEIFSADLKSSGWGPTAYLGGGVDVNIARHIYLVVDIRYSWASPELNQDFVSFDPLDLDGTRATAGLQWHF